MRVLHLTPEFPPVIWGGLGTAVGGLANASAHAGISVGVLLVGGRLVLGDGSYGAWRPVSFGEQHRGLDEPSRSVLMASPFFRFHLTTPELPQFV